ncbi:MAG: hypothetical protein WAK82_14455 [Streptosporangiaceae bacterium]
MSKQLEEGPAYGQEQWEHAPPQDDDADLGERHRQAYETSTAWSVS